MQVQVSEQWIDRLVAWLRDKVEEAGAKGAVFGLSGGIDSAVTAALCQRAFGSNCLGLIMPCHSNPQDEQDARLAAEHLGIETRTIRLDDLYDRFLGLLSVPGTETPELVKANIKPRLRMITLYFHAGLYSYLVVGTGNRSELKVGYFTKYGDGGVDLLPLGNLVKSEVRRLAELLQLPQRVIEKPPSAGLWQGQTDEGEMGFTYADLDRYILTGEAPETLKEKIEEMDQRSAHKKRLPAMFDPHHPS